MTRIALLQMTSGIDPEANFRAIADAAAEAHAQGAQMLFTPEMSILLDRDRARAAPHIEQAEMAFVDRLQAVACDNSLYLALGSMAVVTSVGKWANRSYFFSPDRAGLPIHYDKMHMFDVDLANGESWRELNAYQAGEDVVVSDNTPVGRLGFAICYDLRFPALFEALGERCCDAIAIPAAFTVPTGIAHWHILQRARAIEASAYVISAAQVGEHEDGRRTYGHSLVVDPWGEVLLDMGGEVAGLGFAEINLGRIAEVRAQIPSLANRRKIAN